MWYYYKSLLFGGLSIHPEDIRNLPIRKIDFSNKDIEMHNKLSNLVDEMLTLNRDLNRIGDKKTDKRERLEKEIKDLDIQINKEVYALYGLTDEEIRIVESI